MGMPWNMASYRARHYVSPKRVTPPPTAALEVDLLRDEFFPVGRPAERVPCDEVVDDSACDDCGYLSCGCEQLGYCADCQRTELRCTCPIFVSDDDEDGGTEWCDACQMTPLFEHDYGACARAHAERARIAALNVNKIAKADQISDVVEAWCRGVTPPLDVTPEQVVRTLDTWASNHERANYMHLDEGRTMKAREWLRTRRGISPLLVPTPETLKQFAGFVPENKVGFYNFPVQAVRSHGQTAESSGQAFTISNPQNAYQSAVDQKIESINDSMRMHLEAHGRAFELAYLDKQMDALMKQAAENLQRYQLANPLIKTFKSSTGT